MFLKAGQVLLEKRIACLTKSPKAPLQVHWEDIETFVKKSDKGRCDNDRLNNLREQCLSMSQHIPPDFLTEEGHGPLWKHILSQWNAYLASLVPAEIAWDRPDIQWMGGRTYKYDFHVRYCQGAEVVAERKVEFKQGAKSITELPQFLSLPVKADASADCIMPISYTRVFYDRYLSAMIAADPTAPPELAALPPWEDYAKQVGKVDVGDSAFFRCLKEREALVPAMKTVVKQSIREFLEENVGSFRLDVFVQRVRESQEGKIFCLWDPGSRVFTTDTLDFAADVWNSACVATTIKKHNTVVVEMPADPQGRAFHLLLRWRNHGGVQNPAWQIKVVAPKAPRKKKTSPTSVLPIAPEGVG